MLKEVEQKKYCPSCGFKAPFYTMITAGGEVDKCHHCNSDLPDEAEAARGLELGRVFVVEDTALLREMISDIMVSQGLAREVLACQNGAEFLSRYTQELARGARPGLVLLDVVMPILNGINAAVAMRAVEEGLGQRKVPILFFTVKPCDEQFRKVLSYCSPAMYINKGADASPERMRVRVAQVVARLFQEMERGSGDG